MELIVANPFRILGITSNTTEKELQKQISIIKRYSEVGKSVSFDYDFNFLGELSRDQEHINRAAGQIEQSENKIFHALFWFINLNSIDEIAFNYLKDDNRNKAIEIWKQVISSGHINDSNFHAFSNLSTISLEMSSSNGTIDLEKLRNAIEMKISIIKSDSFPEFVKNVSGNGVLISSEKYVTKFMSEVANMLYTSVKDRRITIPDIMKLISGFPPEVKKIITEKFTLVSSNFIESKIEKSSTELKKDSSKGYLIGCGLYEECRIELEKLKLSLGESNLQYQSIANKLANQLIECAIAFFNNGRDQKDIDPADEALTLTNYASNIAISGPVIHRIRESYEFLQKWKKEAPEREIFNKIGEESVFILKQIERTNYPSILIVEQFIYSCKPKLDLIRAKIGKSNDVYLNLSSTVANKALGMLIEVFNAEQSKALASLVFPTQFKNTVDKIINLFDAINSFDLVSPVRDYLNTNMKIILDTRVQLNNLLKQSQRNSSGCYIATLVYGDYGHPQVILLRKYRDQVLSQNWLGSVFIRFYYRYSPKCVVWLRNKPRFQILIRNILDQIIKRLK